MRRTGLQGIISIYNNMLVFLLPLSSLSFADAKVDERSRVSNSNGEMGKDWGGAKRRGRVEEASWW